MQEHVVPLLGTAFVLAGPVIMWFGARSVARQVHRGRHWRRERATAVGYEWRGSSDNEVQHWVLKRTDAQGRTHRTVTDYGVSGGTLRSFPFDVDVLVDPADEGRFVLAGGCRSGWAGLLVVPVGLFFLAAGATILYFWLGSRS